MPSVSCPASHVPTLVPAAQPTALDRLTKLAARTTTAPIAVLTLHASAGARRESGYAEAADTLPDARLDGLQQELISSGTRLQLDDSRAHGAYRDGNGFSGGPGANAAYLGVPVFTDAGRVLGALAVADVEPRAWTAHDANLLEDIAALVAAELARHEAVASIQSDAVRLRESEGWLRLFVEHASDALLLLDTTATFQFVSPAVQRVYGHAPEALVGTSAEALVHPEDWPVTQAAIARAFQSPGATQIAEIRVLDSSGAWRPCEATGRTGESASAPSGVIVSLRDMTSCRAAEDARRAAEARFRALIEHAHDVVGIIALDGTILYESPAIERALGFHPSEIVGRNAVELIHKDDIPRVAAVLASLAGTPGGAASITYRCQHRDGSWRTIETGAWNLSHDPAVGGVVVNARDITDRAAAETALRESEERFRALSISSPLGIFQSDTLGNLIYTNPRMQTLWDCTDSELLGLGWTSRVHDDDLPATLGAWRTALAAHREFEAEFRVVLPSGTTCHVVARAAPLRDVAGAVIGAVGTVKDVTERKLAGLALAESEQRLRLALTAAHMVAWEIDLRTGAFQEGTQCSSGAVAPAAEAAGTASTVSGKHADYASFLDLVHPEDRSRVKAAGVRSIEERAPFEAEFRMVFPTGIRWRFATGRVVSDGGDVAERMVGVAVDITERKTLEAQLRQAQKMEAVGQLAGGIAHDFNNLLTVITGGTSFARDSLPTGAAAHEDLAMVDEAAGRAAQLTRQLLAFSRKQLLVPEVLDLNQVVSGVEPMLRRLIGEDIAVVTELTPELHDIHADPGQIEQLLLNLSVNARDAMPGGGRLTIRTESVELSPAEASQPGRSRCTGSFVRLTVRDTGIGMDEATLGRIFEPFFTTKELGKGTGLGLATVYGIVAQTGGHVSVSSAPGEGAVFTIDLPPAAAPMTPQLPLPRAMSGLASETVLVVEDEAGVRAIVRRVLSQQGYAVLEASDGREALIVAGEHASRGAGTIDLVVTDVVMPEMSGRELVGMLAVQHPGSRVLFMSGYTDDEIIRRGLPVPGMAFLQKPFTAEQLQTAVRAALGASEVTAAAE